MESDGEDTPVLMIRGERVALGPWHRAIIPHLLRWNNDLTVSLFAGEAPRPVSEERVEALYEQCSKNESEDAVLGLSNVMLAVLSYNERAIRAYTRAGFTVIGRRRGSHRIGEHVYDDVLMDCVSTDFHSPLHPVLDLP
ncbi:MAG: hypothetical protein NVSMB65_18480 [Chloroflexota bacterium]